MLQITASRIQAMTRSAHLLKKPELSYEQWRDQLRPNFGLYTTDKPKIFAGRLRNYTICGFQVSEISSNTRRAHQCERTQRDIRLDGVDHWYALFQIAGRSTIIQNDHAVTLAVGDVAFVDSARAVTYVNDGREQWLALQLPRRLLTTHLGFEPEGGFHGNPGTAGRLLFQLVREAARDEEQVSTAAGSFLQLAVYDLVGALLAPSDGPAPSVSFHSDRLFKRVCNIIQGRFAEPDFGPCEIAADAGISLRYLQKLFADRGLTCSGFIQSLRLDQAARDIKRRALMKSGQPLSAIAQACGYRDYNNFAHAFHRRFGHAPGVHGRCDDGSPLHDSMNKKAR
jgi:AraC family transcriptional regulator, positive regulator of tynA and feaB